MTSAGDAVADHITQLLSREEQRRQRLETRASVTVSLSSAAAAILFAVITYAQESSTNQALTGNENCVVFAALIVLGIAAVASLYTLLPRFQSLANPESLAQYVEEDKFRQPKDYAARRLAEATLDELRDVVSGNSRIAVALLVSQLLEFIGLVLVAVATALVLP